MNIGDKKKIVHKTYMAVISSIMALGGYAGYEVVKTNPNYSILYDASVHTVGRVIDGDTAELNDGTRVRMLGIDSPEQGACGYAESRLYMTNLIEGREVYLEKDVTAQDDFGRLLRYVYLRTDDELVDNILVNDLAVRQGWADNDSVPPNNRYKDLFSAAAQEAQKYERGVWSLCEGDALPFSKTHSGISQQDTGPEGPACVIKGNISTKGFGMSYFIPGCTGYSRTRISTSSGEAYFCTEAEALEAGFRRSGTCDTNFGTKKK